MSGEAVELALQRQQSHGKAPVPAQTSPAARHPAGPSKRIRLSPFEAAAAAHAAGGGDSSAAPSADDNREHMATVVDIEMIAFRSAPGISVWEDNGGFYFIDGRSRFFN